VVKVTIDGIEIEVVPGTTILEAATQAGRYVPTLCFDERMDPFGACRVCMVGVEGAPGPLAACTTPCRDDMVVDTADETSRRIAGATVELVMSELPEVPGEHTELAEVAGFFRIGEPRWQGERRRPAHDARHPYLVIQHELCISCGRCVRACDEIQGAFALTATGRGFGSGITAGLDSGFTESTCVSCGACADTCPTDAITEHLLLELALPSGDEEGSRAPSARGPEQQGSPT
jgi:NADH dehydrogenase/NADH:ubiquinone oxidoreductase subunit G